MEALVFVCQHQQCRSHRLTVGLFPVLLVQQHLKRSFITSTSLLELYGLSAVELTFSTFSEGIFKIVPIKKKEVITSYLDPFVV